MREELIGCPVCGEAEATLFWSGVPTNDSPRREDAADLVCPNGCEISALDLIALFPARVIWRGR